MSTCPGCGACMRKGTTVLLLVDPPRNARVCAACTRRGIVVVAPKVGPVVKQVAPRDSVVESALRSLRTYARAALAAAESPAGTSQSESAHHRGRAEAFEGASELLKSLRGGR